MSGQGDPLDDFQIHRIVSLLARTAMSFAEIAQWMGCKLAAVEATNRRYAVREHAGRRAQWKLNVREGPQERASR